ncbi:MAG: DUF4214 domain-containing protein [Prochloraceae cyanobacterium]|nr:DUF4214 domain-containing protein [Prochloraceae cyanobacterium]
MSIRDRIKYLYESGESGGSSESGQSGYEYQYYNGGGESGGQSGEGANIVNNTTINVNSSNNSNSLTLNAETIQIAYVVYYGRPADGEGREFWGKVFSDNQVSYSPMKGDMLTGNERNLYNQIVNQFGASEEADLLFGGLSYREMIDRVYNFAFDRNAEATGLNYWTEQLQNGSMQTY